MLARQATQGRIAGSHVASSGLQLAIQAPGEVVTLSDDDLSVINDRHSAEELTAEDVVVFQDFALSNARVSDRPIQFTTAALEKLATLAEAGRSVCFNHLYGEIIGATFAGDVAEATVRDVEATWMRLRWYGVDNDRTSPERRQRLQDCRTGALRFGSVGVQGGAWEFVEVETADGWDHFFLIDDADDLQLREYSRVFFPASQGAGDAKFSANGSARAADGPLSNPTPLPVVEAPSPKVICVL